MQYHDIQFNGRAGARKLQVMVAASMTERMRGLLRRPSPGSAQGMLLQPCRLIHTFGMAYPIDVIYLRRDGTVVKVTPALAPARMDGHWRAHSVLEMAAGEAERCGIGPGCIVPLPGAGRR